MRDDNPQPPVFETVRDGDVSNTGYASWNIYVNTLDPPDYVTTNMDLDVWWGTKGVVNEFIRPNILAWVSVEPAQGIGSEKGNCFL